MTRKQEQPDTRCAAAGYEARLWRWMCVILVMGCALVVTGCRKNDNGPAAPASPAISNSRDPQWINQQTPHAKIAVVFVHGIFGDTLDTWTAGNGKTFFQLLKENPEVGPKVDVFAFGFTSNMFQQGSFDVREAANKLQTSLEFKKVLEYPSIVFVAHSMGGLVVLRNLLGNRDLIEKVPVVVLFAAPQEGAQISKIANLVAKNSALSQMFSADHNSFLQTLNDDWRRLKVRPIVACAYEKNETYGQMIVPWSTATRFCDGAPDAIPADHIGIVKPDRAEHESVVVLVNALNKNVLLAKLDTPDFQREGNELVYEMTDPDGRSEARLVNAGGVRLRYTLADVSDKHFYLWPDDTPKVIGPNQTEKLHMALARGADRNEYRFALSTDVTDRQVVLVRIPSLQLVRQKQAMLTKQVMQEISERIGQVEQAGLAELPIGDTRPAEQVVYAAEAAIRRYNPELPEPARWVLAADVLSAANWPDLAKIALTRAEAKSNAVAKTAAVRQLAGFVAARSGDSKIFTSTTTPVLSLAELQQLPNTDWTSEGVASAEFGDWKQLAARLQRIPALKPYGLSFEGDLWRSQGNRDAALQAYKGAASLQNSPFITNRIKEVEVRASLGDPNDRSARIVAPPSGTAAGNKLQGFNENAISRPQGNFKNQAGRP